MAISVGHVFRGITCGFSFNAVKVANMKIQNAVCGNGTSLKFTVFAFLAFISPAASRATELYDLDFTPPDLGTYQITTGNPSVQSMVGPFTNALVFDAVSGGEQIRLPIGVTAPEYEFQCDVLTHNLLNSDYAFGVFFDTPAVNSVNFHGGLNSVYLYQSSPFLNLSLSSLTNDSVYHLDITLDMQNSDWSVAINGNSLFSGPLGGLALQDIRFGLAPWISGAANAPTTYVALDNVIVSAVPEPTTAGLAVAGVLWWLKLQRRTNQIWKQEKENS